ncbi:MAG: ABC transporter substrate-binding protein [Peptostreptococcaceae bacterium]|nr:ABC transporter substrate-binding protein [Peptostreptococcaceae bacterium]
MKKFLLITLFVLVFSLMTGCSGQEDLSKTREAFAQGTEGDIVIGLPGPITYMQELTGFYNGVMLAVDEVNSNNGINGSMIKIRIADDKGTFSDGIKIAQEFASQEDMCAVIGHWNSYITLPAARIYNDAGLVMLSPIVSNSDLTKNGYEYVFQNTINDSEMGRQMADYAKEKGYEHIAVFYADNDYGRGLSNAFEACVADNGGLIVDSMTEFVNDQEFNKAFEKWQALDYDAVFIADSMPHAGEFIKKLKEKDPGIPVFAGDGLDIADLPNALGNAAEGMVIATMYNSESEDEAQKVFLEAFRNKYNVEPDVWAVDGYDSIKLLAETMQKIQSISPAEIAKELHSQKEWKGVMGRAEFNSNGEMTGRSVYKKIVINGKMEYLKN